MINAPGYWAVSQKRGALHCGKLHRKTSSTILWVNAEARTYVTVCEGQHYKSLNTYEPEYLDGNNVNIL